MTVNQRIIAALEPEGIPISPDLYAGNGDMYYTFNFNSAGTLFADDRPSYERHLVQVHFVCPPGFDSVPVRERTKKRLHQAGFSFPEVINAGDGTQQHYVFECEYLDGPV